MESKRYLEIVRPGERGDDKQGARGDTRTKRHHRCIMSLRERSLVQQWIGGVGHQLQLLFSVSWVGFHLYASATVNTVISATQRAIHDAHDAARG